MPRLAACERGRAQASGRRPCLLVLAARQHAPALRGHLREHPPRQPATPASPGLGHTGTAMSPPPFTGSPRRWRDRAPGHDSSRLSCLSTHCHRHAIRGWIGNKEVSAGVTKRWLNAQAPAVHRLSNPGTVMNRWYRYAAACATAPRRRRAARRVRHPGPSACASPFPRRPSKGRTRALTADSSR